jgi:ribonuclease Z
VFSRFEDALVVPKFLCSTLDRGRLVSFLHRECLVFQGLTGWQADVVEIEPGVIFEDERVRVTAFAVKHGSWPQAFGYRFDTSDRTIVVSGDAAPPDVIVEQCRACDVLVHEVYSESGFARRPPEWQRYHAAFHTSTQELAEVATRARPGLLVLYHQLHWGTSDADLLDEVRRGYDGPVVSGRDLGVY